MEIGSDIGAYLRRRFEEKSHAFDPTAWTGSDVSIVYDIRGPEGGRWTISIENGIPRFAEGASGPPTVTISASDTDFRSMMAGKLNPKVAMLTGKVRTAGDRSVLARLRTLLA